MACTKCNMDKSECVTQHCADRMVSPRMKVIPCLTMNYIADKTEKQDQ